MKTPKGVRHFRIGAKPSVLLCHRPTAGRQFNTLESSARLAAHRGPLRNPPGPRLHLECRTDRHSQRLDLPTSCLEQGSGASTEHRGSLRARREEGYILPDNGARPDPDGCQTDATDWWLSSEADSHQTKAPFGCGRASRSIVGEGKQAAAPGDRERRACEWRMVRRGVTGFPC